MEPAKSQPVTDIAEQAGEHDTRPWRFIRHYGAGGAPVRGLHGRGGVLRTSQAGVLPQEKLRGCFDGRVHRHAERLHGLVPGQADQDRVRHGHHGPAAQARPRGIIRRQEQGSPTKRHHPHPLARPRAHQTVAWLDESGTVPSEPGNGRVIISKETAAAPYLLSKNASTGITTSASNSRWLDELGAIQTKAREWLRDCFQENVHPPYLRWRQEVEMSTCSFRI